MKTKIRESNRNYLAWAQRVSKLLVCFVGCVGVSTTAAAAAAIVTVNYETIRWN